ncbi:hypothetical protein OEA41_006584 [Lepraria neglecta]|uniref:3-hydroxyisobutyrate dehydrogenase n=1 Tax=Lepraria neglecta TaxID=209136 RepID=A0AAD9Z815_9LECA|nr:hypothetical protein OEA41_006584 [Lepraria neglecta]
MAKGFGDFIDAPYSGGPMGAEAGVLSFIVGSPSRLYPQVLKIYKMMGKESSIFRYGDLGAGLKTKVLNNYLCPLTAINMGIQNGLEPIKLNEILNVSSG